MKSRRKQKVKRIIIIEESVIIGSIALQMYTLREFTKTPQDIAKTIKRVKEIGYDAIQASALGPIEPTELKKIVDGEGITICATHVGWQRLKDEPEQVIEEHKILGCNVTAIPSLPAEYRNEDGYRRFAKEATEVAKRLAEGGLVTAYHNHSFELVRFGKETGLEILYNESDPNYLKAEIDTYWIQHGGGSPEAWINNLKDRQPIIHVKDMLIKEDGRTQIMAEVGEGNLNWPGILDACKAANIEWIIVEQDICQRDPFESVEISFRNLKEMGL